jgi:hypothetical protein
MECGNGLCVEVASDCDRFVVRGAQYLKFNPGAWSAFMAGIKADRKEVTA